MSKNKEIKTEVEIGDYRGNPMFIIWPVDDNGVKAQYPVISIGGTKAKALIKHLEELKKFVGDK